MCFSSPHSTSQAVSISSGVPCRTCCLFILTFFTTYNLCFRNSYRFRHSFNYYIYVNYLDALWLIVVILHFITFQDLSSYFFFICQVQGLYLQLRFSGGAHQKQKFLWHYLSHTMCVCVCVCCHMSSIQASQRILGSQNSLLTLYRHCLFFLPSYVYVGGI